VLGGTGEINGSLHVHLEQSIRPVLPRLLPSLALAAFAATSLVLGASYLGATLPGGLPLGNLLTAAGLISLAFAAVVLSAPATGARTFATLATTLTAIWLPASVILAGNLALNFQGSAGSIWAAMSAVTLLVALVALVWATGQRLLRRLRRRAIAGAA
jgi:hypothetical protein